MGSLEQELSLEQLNNCSRIAHLVHLHSGDDENMSSY